MPTRPAPTTLTLEQAIDLTRTGDIWIFRGHSVADRAIQTVTNAPVNHVGMAVVLDDLPPLMWHAELGQKLTDVWTGGHHRGVQLHDLRDAVVQWRDTYGQRPWLRQLTPDVTRAQEDALLKSIARLDGVPFPSTMRLAGRWLRSRDAYLPKSQRGHAVRPEMAYCAEVVAITFQEMGLLPDDLRPGAFDPGSFWSGDRLPLTSPYALGGEIAVT